MSLQQLTPSLLVVKLNGWAFSSSLADTSPQRLESAAQFKVGEGKTGGELKLALSSLSIAEDLYSLGLAFLQVLLGALAEEEVVVKGEPNREDTEPTSSDTPPPRDKMAGCLGTRYGKQSVCLRSHSKAWSVKLRTYLRATLASYERTASRSLPTSEWLSCWTRMIWRGGNS